LSALVGYMNVLDLITCKLGME